MSGAAIATEEVYNRNRASRMLQGETLSFTRNGNAAQANLDVPHLGTVRATVRQSWRLDGQPTTIRSWEVALRRPMTKVLACGTSANRKEAEAAVEEAMKRIVAAASEKRARRLTQLRACLFQRTER